MIGAVILAAGASERMGRPKALLPFGADTALSMAVDACRYGGIDRIALVLGAAAREILPVAEEIIEGNLEVVLHHKYMDGRTSSIQAGWARLGDAFEALLVYPVDHALVTRHEVTALLDTYLQADDPAVLVPVCEGRRGHPVLLAGPALLDLPRLGPDAPLRDLIHAHPILEVPTDNPWISQDLNTPESYQTALAAWREQSTP